MDLRVLPAAALVSVAACLHRGVDAIPGGEALAVVAEDNTEAGIQVDSPDSSRPTSKGSRNRVRYRNKSFRHPSSSSSPSSYPQLELLIIAPTATPTPNEIIAAAATSPEL